MNSIVNDKNIEREKLNNPRRNVAVIGILKGSQILMVRTKRLPNQWQPIGGGMKPFDQSPTDTLLREVKEEINISLSKESVKFEIETSYDFGEGSVYFYSTKFSLEENPIFDTNELAEWQWFNIKDALELSIFPATKKFLDHLVLSYFQSDLK